MSSKWFGLRRTSRLSLILQFEFARSREGCHTRGIKSRTCVTKYLACEQASQREHAKRNIWQAKRAERGLGRKRGPCLPQSPSSSARFARRISPPRNLVPVQKILDVVRRFSFRETNPQQKYRSISVPNVIITSAFYFIEFHSTEDIFNKRLSKRKISLHVIYVISSSGTLLSNA